MHSYNTTTYNEMSRSKAEPLQESYKKLRMFRNIRIRASHAHAHPQQMCTFHKRILFL